MKVHVCVSMIISVPTSRRSCPKEGDQPNGGAGGAGGDRETEEGGGGGGVEEAGGAGGDRETEEGGEGGGVEGAGGCPHGGERQQVRGGGVSGSGSCFYWSLETLRFLILGQTRRSRVHDRNLHATRSFRTFGTCRRRSTRTRFPCEIPLSFILLIHVW